jgi:cytochrome c oxidase subunit IV
MNHDPHAIEQSYEKGAHVEHHGGVGVYVAVALALVFLTACSYWTYTPFWPFGHEGDAALAIKRLWMMAVSCTKAMLVILFFMHLKWEANWKWVLTVPASLMSLLLILALVPDIGQRIRYASRQRLTYSANEPAPEQAIAEPPHEPAGTSGRAEPPVGH